MKLIALLVALGLERLATQLFHLRELRWLDRLFDPGLRLIEGSRQFPGWLMAALVVIVFVAPVFLLRLAIGDVFLGVPYLLLSVVVLFFSLGPQDIFEEVSTWSGAVEAGDEARSAQLAKALLECDPRASSRIDEAIFVQANNRIFAVVFWFIVLGPVGAWAVRVADLLRRRAVFRSQRGTEIQASEASATDLFHALLAWIPARLGALSYALAGSFDTGRDAWKLSPAAERSQSLGEANERLLARVGSAALDFTPREGESQEDQQVRSARMASGLVFRALVFWAVAVAALTLFSPAF